MYVRNRKRNEVHVYVTIKPKGLSQRFEEGEEGDRQIRCLQYNPEKKKPNAVVHLKIDAAMESRRSYKEVRSSRWRTFLLTVCQVYCFVLLGVPAWRLI